MITLKLTEEELDCIEESFLLELEDWHDVIRHSDYDINEEKKKRVSLLVSVLTQIHNSKSDKKRHEQR